MTATALLYFATCRNIDPATLRFSLLWKAQRERGIVDCHFSSSCRGRFATLGPFDYTILSTGCCARSFFENSKPSPEEFVGYSGRKVWV